MCQDRREGHFGIQPSSQEFYELMADAQKDEVKSD